MNNLQHNVILLEKIVLNSSKPLIYQAISFFLSMSNERETNKDILIRV